MSLCLRDQRDCSCQARIVAKAGRVRVTFVIDEGASTPKRPVKMSIGGRRLKPS